MDESLSDFQETKITFAVTKTTGKSKSSKPKKAPKRIRGQKDIRTVLQSKKNELESYSEDFDKVCKKAGIDVDSEELQLAVALSKSLDPASTSKEASANSLTVNTQERVNKIRTTLQEYGFKVPEIKIAANARKHRKHRKNYKLIFTSEKQKKEIVADKYSHVLLHHITQCSLYKSDIDLIDIPLYNLASNVTYDLLKVTDTFYVNNLIEKSTSTGNLLRDWSEIPGRPVSPKLFEHSKMNFSVIDCSQDELDTVLSGSLKICKNIFKNKCNDFFSDSACKIIITDNNDANVSVGNIIDLEKINTSDHGKTLIRGKNIALNLVESLSTTKRYRSCSPDIFDDDESQLFENSKNSPVQEEKKSSKLHNIVTKNILEIMDLTESVLNQNSMPDYSVNDNSQTIKLNSDVTKRKSNDLMDITECIQIQTKDNFTVMHKTVSQLYQDSNVTKRRSNDLMEITECVGVLSQPLQDNIDLTQSPDIIEKNSVREEFVTNKCDENIDESRETSSKPNLILTASPKHNNIDLTESPIQKDDGVTNNRIARKQKEINLDKSIDSMDLTQSSNTSDELPFVSLTAPKNNSLDDTITEDMNDYAHINRKMTNLQKQAEVHIDLTQYSGSMLEASNQSPHFFEEYIHNHSGNSEEPINTNPINTGYEQCELGKVNLTLTLKRKSNPSHLHSFDESTRSSCEECGSHSQSKSVNVNPKKSHKKMITSINPNCSDIIEPLSVELHSSSSDYKLCKPGNVDLTLTPIEQSVDNKVDDIDLTQNSDTSEELSQTLYKCGYSKSTANDISNDFDTNISTENEPETAKKSPICSLGKIDDVSIDYDDFLNIKADNEPNSSKSVVYEIADENIERHCKDISFVSNCSQTSDVFEISDKELDYSMHQSKLEIPAANFQFGGLSIMDEMSKFGTCNKSVDFDNTLIVNNLNEVGNESLPTVSTSISMNDNKCKGNSPITHRRITEIATPQKACSINMVTAVTPRNSELIIQTNNITPLIYYELMSTPEIHMELDKYGIKPFKRKRAIHLLTHIYNQTHPIIETYIDELASPPKRRKLNDDQPTTSTKKQISPRKLLTSPRVVEECYKCKQKNLHKDVSETSKEKNDNDKFKNIQITNYDKGKGSAVNKKKHSKRKYKNSQENQKKSGPVRIEDSNSTHGMECRSKEVVSEVITDAPILRDVQCRPEDWVFQKREKSKVHSCRVPLHVAFHNYVSSRRELREAILCYEPVEIDVIHKDLAGYGHRYDPKDLLKFLDKRCITVKTTDNDARNNKTS